MVKLIPPPAGVQDTLVYDYLYQLQEYLSLALERSSAGAAAAATAAASRTAERAASAELTEQVRYLKALIIKTADTVEEHTRVDLSGLRDMIEALGEVIEGDGGLRVQLMEIRNDYLAQSVFGSYREEVAQQLEATAAGLTQYIRFASDLQADLDAVAVDFAAWRTESEGYIRSGIVGYREDETPIIGIAIGQNLTVKRDASGNDATETVDGVSYRIVEQKGFRAIYAADELSFWQGENKVAYMSNNQLFITNVVALASLQVGRWDITDGAAGLCVKWIGG